MGGLGILNAVYHIPLYLMISRDYQNGWTNGGWRPSFVLFLLTGPQGNQYSPFCLLLFIFWTLRSFFVASLTCVVKCEGGMYSFTTTVPQKLRTVQKIKCNKRKNADFPVARRHLSSKALIQPAYLARIASWLAFVVAIFMVHEMATTKANQEMAPAKHAG